MRMLFSIWQFQGAYVLQQMDVKQLGFLIMLFVISQVAIQV